SLSRAAWLRGRSVLRDGRVGTRRRGLLRNAALRPAAARWKDPHVGPRRARFGRAARTAREPSLRAFERGPRSGTLESAPSGDRAGGVLVAIALRRPPRPRRGHGRDGLGASGWIRRGDRWASRRASSATRRLGECHVARGDDGAP